MATPEEALKERAKYLTKSLASSATAYSPKTVPSFSDISTDKQLSSVNKQIEDLRSKNIRTKWYGPADAPVEDSGSSDGWLMGGLKALQKPLNAIAGTVQYAVGEGTKPNLASNINEATKSGLTFGNILQQKGASRGVQIPLGFALDVMFDPVNWLTAGTAALIPRVGTGLVKGTMKGGIKQGLEAAGTGFVSNVQKKAATVMNLTPFVKKMAQISPVIEEGGLKVSNFSKMIGKGAAGYTNFAEKLGEKAIKGADKYDDLIGTSIKDRLGVSPFGYKGDKIANTLEDVVRGKVSVPGLGFLSKEVAPNVTKGDKIVDFFKYSPEESIKIADLKDKVEQLYKNKGLGFSRSKEGAHFFSLDDFNAPGATIKIEEKVGEALDVAIRDADGVLKTNIPNMPKIKIYDSAENAKILLEQAGEEINMKRLFQAYKKAPKPGTTGVQWFDTAIEKIKDTKIGDMFKQAPKSIEEIKTEADDLVKTWNSYDNKVLDFKPFDKILTAYPIYTSIFKGAKVPMNVASHVVANIGNFFMGSMMGLPVYKTEYINAVRDAKKLITGKLGAKGLQDIFFGDVNSLFDMVENHPNRFRMATGLDVGEIQSKLEIAKKWVGDAPTVKEELLKFMKEAAEGAEKSVAKRAVEFEKMASKAEREAFALKNPDFKKYSTGTETAAKLADEAPLSELEQSTAFSGELTNDTMDKIKGWVTKKAQEAPNNPIAQLADTVVNSMPRWYEQIDQSWKIGTTNFLARHGLNEEQLIKVSRTVPIEEGDIIHVATEGAEKLYRLSPLKASEVALDTFMNYSAMPDFVRIMRAIPFGSPFMSFPYAMAIKTSKTAINNPAIFNDVGFMLNEINADRSPQERAAMETKYNEYLKSPTVIKVSGMFNTNVKNMIPWYQMNMFNPSERNYSNSTGGNVMKYLDKFPVFDDPVGAVVKDYFIQPWILGSGDVAQGQFGEPLYPSFDANGKKIDVGLGTKALYGGRAITEAVVPGTFSYAGALNMIGDGLPDEVINAVPSYGFRNLANAAQGKSSIGAKTKENVIQKTLRSILGRSGIPAYTLDTTKTSSE